MRTNVITLLFLTIAISSFGQSSRKMLKEEKQAVQKVVDSFIEGLNSGDRNKVENTLHFTTGLLTIYKKEERSMIAAETKDDLLYAISLPRNNQWKEVINKIEIQVDGDLAQVWAEYTFYLDGNLLHCGIDAFQLFKGSDGWKIIQITDTRKTEGCK